MGKNRGDFIKFSKIACSYRELSPNIYDKVAEKRHWCGQINAVVRDYLGRPNK